MSDVSRPELDSLILTNKPNSDPANKNSLYDLVENGVNLNFNNATVKYHVVKRDEEMRLDLISYREYRRVDLIHQLCKLNGLLNPFCIKEGDTLLVGDPKEVELVEGVVKENDVNLRAALIMSNKAFKLDTNRTAFLKETQPMGSVSKNTPNTGSAVSTITPAERFLASGGILPTTSSNTQSGDIQRDQASANPSTTPGIISSTIPSTAGISGVGTTTSASPISPQLVQNTLNGDAVSQTVLNTILTDPTLADTLNQNAVGSDIIIRNRTVSQISNPNVNNNPNNPLYKNPIWASGEEPVTEVPVPPVVAPPNFKEIEIENGIIQVTPSLSGGNVDNKPAEKATDFAQQIKNTARRNRAEEEARLAEEKQAIFNPYLKNKVQFAAEELNTANQGETVNIAKKELTDYIDRVRADEDAGIPGSKATIKPVPLGDIIKRLPRF